MTLSRIYRWSEVMNMVVLIIQVDSVTIPIQKKISTLNIRFVGKLLHRFKTICIFASD